ncbi:N-acetylmuramoyl-L-alanine amidase [Chitinophaga ginsengisegetis]|uniref:N-acetylmuramoyl-L-alanine amidase n=1 Tax=Chitinophaga ginsengisegetis TaxID=393003 RepID=A0A1T5PBN0_9BACT|nr:N-acetylmuramoyl-L-alanine amidase [Chitinophaga ginsengisegetis]SKD10086.1 N-acetylmuramoyl-L-alanine amidase [Chitinophaga ginsengisegetis]
MREIKNIVLHCTATQPTATVESILRFWRTSRKWRDPGYHYIIEFNGNVRNLQPEEKPSNGVAGHNLDSIHVSYIGGIDREGKPEDTRSSEQRIAMKGLVQKLHQRYPTAIILGHRDFPNVPKACPSFDVRSWLKEENVL